MEKVGIESRGNAANQQSGVSDNFDARTFKSDYAVVGKCLQPRQHRRETIDRCSAPGANLLDIDDEMTHDPLDQFGAQGVVFGDARQEA